MALGREAPGKPVQDMTSSRKTQNLCEEGIAETRNGMAGLFFLCVCALFASFHRSTAVSSPGKGVPNTK